MCLKVTVCVGGCARLRWCEIRTDETVMEFVDSYFYNSFVTATILKRNCQVNMKVKHNFQPRWWLL